MSTIVALATPPGIGAIHVIRISGEDTYSIINKVSLDPVKKDENRVQATYLKARNSDKNLMDQVLLIKFYKPDSYTGEDFIEISCHGSNLVVKIILEELVRNGAVYAEKGEFSRRAFLNNRIDFNQALNIRYLFQARSEKEVFEAIRDIRGDSSSKINEISKMILNCIGECEANIDYPPEIESDDTNLRKKINKDIGAILSKVEEILENSKSHKASSFRIALVGRPNAGKSSLINFLLDKNRIIVSDIAGTTRDSIEVDYFFEGFLLTFVDTAGIRESDDILESEGIKRSRDEIKKADLIFHLISLEEGETEEDKDIIDFCKGKNFIKVFTKSDLVKNPPKDSISIKSKDIEFFNGEIRKYLKTSYTPLGIKSQEGINFLNNCAEELKKGMNISLTLDLIATHLSNALDALSLILHAPIDKANNLFDNFCIGK